MPFAVRDLSLNVFPAADANDPELWLCVMSTQGEPKPPPGPGKPPPKPPRPECPMESQQTTGNYEAGVALASLAELRAQLRQALHP